MSVGPRRGWASTRRRRPRCRGSSPWVGRRGWPLHWVPFRWCPSPLLTVPWVAVHPSSPTVWFRWFSLPHNQPVRSVMPMPSSEACQPTTCAHGGGGSSQPKEIQSNFEWRLDALKGLDILVASRLPVVEGETLAVGVTRALDVMDVGSLRTEASQSPEREGAGRADLWRRTVASRSPGAECPTWAAGVSAQALSAMIGGSKESGRNELGTFETTWKSEGELPTVSETPETICWFACG